MGRSLEEVTPCVVAIFLPYFQERKGRLPRLAPLTVGNAHVPSIRRVVARLRVLAAGLRKRVDRIIRPFSYALLAVVFFAELFFLFLANPATQSIYLTPISILLSALTATCGWMWSGHINRRIAKRTVAIELLLHLRGKEINDWKSKVYKYISDGGGEVPDEDIQKVLGYYEFLSISVMRGAADEAMIEQSQKYVYYRLYSGLKPYIDKAIERHKDNYCHFIYYAKRWNPEHFQTTPLRPPNYVPPDTEF